MRKLFVVLLLVLVLLMAVAAPVGAQGGPTNERACVGLLFSSAAHELGGVGPEISEAAKALHPFGQVVSVFATTCEFAD